MSSNNLIQDKREAEIDRENILQTKMRELFHELVEKGLPVKNARFYNNRINYFRGIEIYMSNKFY